MALTLAMRCLVLAHIALGALSADLAASRRELSDRGAAGRDIDGMGSFADADGDTDDCAVLQLPLHAAAASGSPPGALPGRGPSGGGHAAGRGGNLSLLDAGEAQRRSVLALQGLARLREEQGRVRAALESERGENGRVEAEVAERLKEAALLEQELLTKQAVVGRGPMAFVPGFLHGKLATVAAVVAGVVIFLAIMCFVMRYSTANSQVRAKRLTAREGEEAECGLTRSEPVIGDEDEEDDSDDDEDSNCMMCLKACRGCVCGCSLQTMMAFYSVLAVWSLGLAVMWKLNILQPFLQNMAVIVIFVSGLSGLVVLSLAETWITISDEFDNAIEFMQHIHDKVDVIMTAMGFAEHPKLKDEK
mmetsp:Transcript_178770/g.572981  ORF Transcript_178770/g.572981 Transcript_178770/m.572981 type:complete len:362 (-) Transcript_178770:134-1219(-)